MHPLIVKAQREALSSQIADLKEELREYESLKASLFQLDQLKTVAELPTLLIKARIAQGLSQKELAERLGLKGATDTAVRSHGLCLSPSRSNSGSRRGLGYRQLNVVE